MNFDEINLNEDDQEITQQQLNILEKHLDKLYAALGMDVEFTRHFLDRVNDPRNKKQITLAELVRLFKEEFKKYGKEIANMGANAEAVMMDMKTDVNLPFVLNVDRQNNELDLVAKTVMRKKNFFTNDPKLTVESSKKKKKKSKMPKQRDPNSQYMIDLRKSGAAGAHKDKRQQGKDGYIKHKGKLTDIDESSGVRNFNPKEIPLRPATTPFRKIHGNFCGPGNTGELPTDFIDQECQKHDYCYADNGWGDRGCDVQFIKDLAQLIKDNVMNWTKQQKANIIKKYFQAKELVKKGKMESAMNEFYELESLVEASFYKHELEDDIPMREVPKSWLPFLKIYGNYCGWGRKGGEPKDLVDKACQIHDYCTDDHGTFSRGCDKDFVNNLRKSIRIGIKDWDDEARAHIMKTFFQLVNAINIGDGDKANTELAALASEVEGGMKQQIRTEAIRQIAEHAALDINDIWYPDPKDTWDIPRSEMPQIEKKHYPKLWKWLEKRGVSVKQTHVYSDEVKPIQGEYTQAGVLKALSKGGANEKPIIVSNDDFILDGHHRWLAAMNTDPHTDFPAYKIDLPMKSLLKLINTFPKVTYKDIYEEIDETVAWFNKNKGQSQMTQETKTFNEWVDNDHGGATVEDIKDSIIHRLHNVNRKAMMAALEQRGIDDLMDAIEDVANFHEGTDELGSSDISIMVKQVIDQLDITVEETVVHEGEADIATALTSLGSHDDMDGKDYQAVANMIQQGSSIELIRDYILDLDTEPRENILNVVALHDPQLISDIFPKDHVKDYFSAMNEAYEHDIDDENSLHGFIKAMRKPITIEHEVEGVMAAIADWVWDEELEDMIETVVEKARDDLLYSSSHEFNDDITDEEYEQHLAKWDIRKDIMVWLNNKAADNPDNEYYQSALDQLSPKDDRQGEMKFEASGEEEGDKVIFRKFPEDGDVIALFPEHDEGRGMINSYMHVGQHGEASMELIDKLEPASPEEYDNLLAELKRIGYNPVVVDSIDEAEFDPKNPQAWDTDKDGLPPHLAKFFDKDGNLNPDAEARVQAGNKKRNANNWKDVTPKGYGPDDIGEGKSPHKKGTKKYNDHMAAIHAESINEDGDDLKTKIKHHMQNAVKNPENRNDDGSINWNFVDADTFMDVSPEPKDVDKFYHIFNMFADKLDNKDNIRESASAELARLRKMAGLNKKPK